MPGTHQRSGAAPAASPQPAVAGIPPEVWAYLRETMTVRPHVVARVRASLQAGVQPTSDEVALAMLHGSQREVA